MPAKKRIEEVENEKLKENAKTSKTVGKRKSSKTETSKKSSSKSKESVKVSTKNKISTTKKKSTTSVKKTETAKKQKTPSTAKKVSSTRKSTKKATVIAIPATEYYDLPFRYNETIVKILAQTPKSLFVYWDISDDLRKNLLDTFGENFFNDTIPFLRIMNETNNYSFDVDVDDFANGWYVPINDSKCVYSVLLFRKQRAFRNKIIDNEIYITNSNELEVPNDHILFEKLTPNVYYKNIKNNAITVKNIPASIFANTKEKIYGLYNYYKEIYKNENIEETFDLQNPSSSNPTSTFR